MLATLLLALSLPLLGQVAETPATNDGAGTAAAESAPAESAADATTPAETADSAQAVAEAAAASSTGTPSNDDIFQSILNKLTSGDFQGISGEEWQFFAVHFGMRVALALIALFLALTIAGWAGSAVRASLNRMNFDPTLSKFLSKLARWAVLLLAGLACLGTLGVETTSFAAVLGAAGFAVGLAFQGTLSNFASGAMLLIFRPFRVGDVINVAGQMGKVDEIELFTTTLDTPDNRRIILPNSAVFGSTIENVTYHPLRRVDIAVGAAYDADLDATRAALMRAVEQTEGVVTDPESAIVLTGLGASSVDWVVRAWARTDDYFPVHERLTGQIKRSLDEAGIGIPYPQMDIHVQQPAA